MRPSFDDYFKPLALIGNIFGVIYFSPKANTGNYIFIYVRCIPFIVLFVSTSIIAMKLQYEADYSQNSRIKKIGDIFPLCVCVFWTYTKFIYYSFNRTNYETLIKDLTKLGARCDLHRKRSNNWINIGIWIGSLVTFFLVHCNLNQYDMNLAFTITFSLGIYVGIYESIFMSSIIKELEDIFQYINKKLEQHPTFLNIPQNQNPLNQKLSNKNKMDHEKQPKFIKTRDKKIFLENIDNLIELHFETTNVCRRMNQIFTYPLLGLILIGFTFIVNCGETFLFNIFAAYNIKGFILPVYETEMHTFWSILELNHLFFTIRPWAQLTEESAKTSTHIHEIWNTLAIDNEIDENSIHLQLIAVQLLNHKLKFNANGLFPINLGLFQMILAAVSTYIVILIQFEMSATKKNLKKISTIP